MANNSNNSFKESIETSVSKVSRMKIFNFEVSTKTVIILMVCLIAALGCLSVYVVLNDDENILNYSSTQESDTSNTSTYVGETTEIDEDILLVFTDDDQDDIHMMLLVSLETRRYNITFKFIDAQQQVQLDNETMRLEEYYSTYGMTQFLAGTMQVTGDEVERYILMSESNFASFVDLTGECGVNVTSDISYNYNGINYIFTEGYQALTSDMLTKYMLYLSELGQSGEEEIIEILSIYLETFFELYSVEDGYDALVKIVTTNISAYDIMEHKAGLEALIGEEEKTVILDSTIESATE